MKKERIVVTGYISYIEVVVMAHTVIAAVGDNMDSLFVGVREFPTKRIILITHEDKVALAEKTKKDLEKFKIPVQIKKVEGEPWEAIFQAVKEIKKCDNGRTYIFFKKRIIPYCLYRIFNTCRIVHYQQL